jgi:hypothetical protein
MKRDFADGVYLSEAQSPIFPPPPPHIHRIRVYSVFIHTGKWKGGGGLNQREGYRDNSSQSWVENTKND